jgi:hypothetical protein
MFGEDAGYISID